MILMNSLMPTMSQSTAQTSFSVLLAGNIPHNSAQPPTTPASNCKLN